MRVNTEDRGEEVGVRKVEKLYTNLYGQVILEKRLPERDLDRLLGSVRRSKDSGSRPERVRVSHIVVSNERYESSPRGRTHRQVGVLRTREKERWSLWVRTSLSVKNV